MPTVVVDRRRVCPLELFQFLFTIAGDPLFADQPIVNQRIAEIRDDVGRWHRAGKYCEAQYLHPVREVECDLVLFRV